jgi:hypothetical protein
MANATGEIEAVPVETAQMIALAERMNPLELTRQEQADQWGISYGMLRDLEDEIVEHHAPMKRAALAALDAVRAAERKLLDPVRGAIGRVKAALDAWETKKRLEAAAREEERMARARAAQEELALQEAEALSEAGLAESAERTLERAIHEGPVGVGEPVPVATAGTLTRWGPWKWEIVDAFKVRDKYLAPDAEKIAFEVKRRGVEAEKEVGGIRVWREAIVARRRR